MRGYINEVNPEELGQSLRFVRLPFCWSWPGDCDVIWKRGGNRIRGTDFELRFRHLLHTVIGDRRKFYAEIFYFFILEWQKRIAFKSCLDACIFVSWLLDYFDMPSSSSEPRKRYILTVLLMCPGKRVYSSPAWMKMNNLGEGFVWGTGGWRKLWLLPCGTHFPEPIPGSRNSWPSEMALLSLV